MKIIHHVKSTILPIGLAIVLLFSNCKQSLKMQGDYQKKESPRATINYNDNIKLLNNTKLLFEAVKTGNKELVEELLLTNIDINAKDVYGETHLHWAVNKENLEVADLLIEAGADVNAKDRDGNTALHWAATTNNLDFFKLIKEIVLGKNEEYNMLNKVNIAYCLKHLLIEKNILSNSIYDKSLIRGIIKLSELNVDLSIKNNNVKTSLDIAKEEGHLTIIEILEELENVIKNDQMIPFTDYITSK